MTRAKHLSKGGECPDCPKILGITLFYLGYGIYTFIALLDNSNLNESKVFLLVDNLLKIIPLILLIAASALISRRNVRAALISVAILLSGLLSYITSKDGAFFWLTLCFIACRGARLRDLARVNLVSTCFAALVVLVLWSSGLIPQTVDWNAGIARYSLGFSTPNRCANTMLAAYIAYGILNLRKKDSKDVYIIGILLMCASYLLTHSRTTVAIFVVAMLSLAVFRSVDELSTTWKQVSTFGLLAIAGLCIIASIYMAYAYTSDNNIMATINDALSQRLSYARMYSERYSVTLFGRDFSNAPIEYGNGRQGTHFLVDNAYVHLLLRFGLVPFALYAAAVMTPILFCGIKREWSATALGLFIMAIFGISETNAIYAETNFFVISGVSLISSGSLTNCVSEDSIRDKRERILFCYGEFDGAKCGVADYTRRLCVELNASGKVIPVIAYQGPKKYRNYVIEGHGFEGIQIESWRQGKSMLCLAFQARGMGCVTIHIQYPAVGYGRSAAVVLLSVAAKLLGLRIIYTVHEYSIYSWKGKAKQLLCMLLADEIIAVDINELNQIRHIGILRKKLNHISIAPSIPKSTIRQDQRDSIRKQMLGPRHEKAAGFFGFANESKYTIQLVNAFALLKRRGQLVSKLVIIGELNYKDSYQKRVLEQIHDLELEDDVYITGYLDAQLASNYIACCDFMLLPTSHGAAERNSSFLACYQNGVPIVTSKPKGPFSYQEVRFFQSEDVDSFAEAILEMQAKTTVVRKDRLVPDWKTVMLKHLKIYQRNQL